MKNNIANLSEIKKRFLVKIKRLENLDISYLLEEQQEIDEILGKIKTTAYGKYDDLSTTDLYLLTLRQNSKGKIDYKIHKDFIDNNYKIIEDFEDLYFLIRVHNQFEELEEKYIEKTIRLKNCGKISKELMKFNAESFFRKQKKKNKEILEEILDIIETYFYNDFEKYIAFMNSKELEVLYTTVNTKKYGTMEILEMLHEFKIHKETEIEIENPTKKFSFDKYLNYIKSEIFTQLLQTISTSFHLFHEYSFDLNKGIKEVKNKNNKEIKCLKNLCVIIDKVQKKDYYILSQDEIKVLMSEKEHIDEILNYIKDKNDVYIAKQQEEIKNKRENSNYEYIKKFEEYSYKFIFTKEELNKVKTLGLEKLDLKLNYMKKLGIQIESDFIEILLNSNETILKELIKIYERKIISTDYILKHKELLFSMEAYSNFKRNLDLLSSEVSIKKLQKSVLLTVDNSVLSSNIILAKEYGLDLEQTSIQFLKDSKTFDVLDTIIESGYYCFIKENTKHLLKSRKPNTLLGKQLYVCKLIGHNPIIDGDLNQTKLTHDLVDKNEEELNEVICSQTDENVDEEFKAALDNSGRLEISEDTKNSSVVEKLNEYRVGDLIYMFGEIVISRNKVLRNIEVLKKYFNGINEKEIIFNAIIYGSYLNSLEIAQIQDILFGVKEKMM
jgi:hypothetical protein